MAEATPSFTPTGRQAEDVDTFGAGDEISLPKHRSYRDTSEPCSKRAFAIATEFWNAKKGFGMVFLSEYLAASSLTASISFAITLRREALGVGDERSSPRRTEVIGTLHEAYTAIGGSSIAPAHGPA